MPKAGERSDYDDPRVEELQEQLAEAENERDEAEARIEGALEHGWENGDIKAMHYQLTKDRK